MVTPSSLGKREAEDFFPPPNHEGTNGLIDDWMIGRHHRVRRRREQKEEEKKKKKNVAIFVSSTQMTIGDSMKNHGTIKLVPIPGAILVF